MRTIAAHVDSSGAGLEHCGRTMRRACASVAADPLGGSAELAEKGTSVPDSDGCFRVACLFLRGLAISLGQQPTVGETRPAPKEFAINRGGSDERFTQQ